METPRDSDFDMYKVPELQRGRLYSAWDFTDITDQAIDREIEEKVFESDFKEEAIDFVALYWAYSDASIITHSLRYRIDSRLKPLHKYEDQYHKFALNLYRTYNKKYNGRNIFELSMGCNAEEHQTSLLQDQCGDSALITKLRMERNDSGSIKFQRK
ncbi:hypothetical protein TSAR_005405, partial [Trichomalopsis sarcophagae]